MTCLWKSANNADSHKPLGFAAFPTGPTAGMHHNQPISGQQRSTLRPGIFCLKNGETLRKLQRLFVLEPDETMVVVRGGVDQVANDLLG